MLLLPIVKVQLEALNMRAFDWTNNITQSLVRCRALRPQTRFQGLPGVNGVYTSKHSSFQHQMFVTQLLFVLQDSQTKIRIHGSRKKGVIIQSDVVASNGMIHVINKLMDSVAPTVESDTQVETCSVKEFSDKTLMGGFIIDLLCFLAGESDEDHF